MIDPKTLSPADAGRWVRYTRGQPNLGTLYSWNPNFLFVTFGRNTQAVSPEDLEWPPSESLRPIGPILADAEPPQHPPSGYLALTGEHGVPQASMDDLRALLGIGPLLVYTCPHCGLVHHFLAERYNAATGRPTLHAQHLRHNKRCLWCERPFTEEPK